MFGGPGLGPRPGGYGQMFDQGMAPPQGQPMQQPLQQQQFFSQPQGPQQYMPSNMQPMSGYNAPMQQAPNSYMPNQGMPQQGGQVPLSHMGMPAHLQQQPQLPSQQQFHGGSGMQMGGMQQQHMQQQQPQFGGPQHMLGAPQMSMGSQMGSLGGQGHLGSGMGMSGPMSGTGGPGQGLAMSGGMSGMVGSTYRPAPAQSMSSVNMSSMASQHQPISMASQHQPISMASQHQPISMGGQGGGGGGGGYGGGAPSGMRAPLATVPPGTPLCGTRLFVANVMNAPIAEISNWFGIYGPLAAPPEKFSTFAFVEYADPANALTALYGENGRPFAGRRLEVKPALTRDQAASVGRGKATRGGPMPMGQGAAPMGMGAGAMAGAGYNSSYGPGAPVAGYVAPNLPPSAGSAGSVAGGLPKKSFPAMAGSGAGYGQGGAGQGMKRGRDEEGGTGGPAQRKRMDGGGSGAVQLPPGVREAVGRVFFQEFPARKTADKMLEAVKALALPIPGSEAVDEDGGRSTALPGLRAELCLLPKKPGVTSTDLTVPVSIADMHKEGYLFAVAVNTASGKDGSVVMSLVEAVAEAANEAGVTLPQRVRVARPEPVPVVSGSNEVKGEGEEAQAGEGVDGIVIDRTATAVEPEPAASVEEEWTIAERPLPVPCVDLRLPNIEAAAELLRACLLSWDAAQAAAAAEFEAAADASAASADFSMAPMAGPGTIVGSAGAGSHVAIDPRLAGVGAQAAEEGSSSAAAIHGTPSLPPVSSPVVSAGPTPLPALGPTTSVLLTVLSKLRGLVPSAAQAAAARVRSQAVAEAPALPQPGAGVEVVGGEGDAGQQIPASEPQAAESAGADDNEGAPGI